MNKLIAVCLASAAVAAVAAPAWAQHGPPRTSLAAPGPDTEEMILDAEAAELITPDIAKCKLKELRRVRVMERSMRAAKPKGLELDDVNALESYYYAIEWNLTDPTQTKPNPKPAKYKCKDL